MALASLSAPELMVLVPTPPPEDSTNGVPDTVRLVTVPVFHIVAVAEFVKAILPVPKLMVLVPVPLLANVPVVNVKLPNARVPVVRVVVNVVAEVRLS